MKQRCAILSCDYFDGGDCQNLCSLGPKPPRTISIQPADVPQAKRQDLPPLEIDVAEPDPEPIDPEDDRIAHMIAAMIIVVLFLTLITLARFA